MNVDCDRCADDKLKICNFCHLQSQQNGNITLDLLYLGIYAVGPRFWSTDSKFQGEVKSALHSGFRCRSGELNDSGAFGSEGYECPFRRARPKLTSFSDPPYLKPRSTCFLVPAGIIRPIEQTEPVSGWNSNPARAGKLFGSAKRPKRTRGYQESMMWGFGYGESEYEISFGRAP